MAYTIPKDILDILQTLEDAKFEAFIVGGSVRDLLLGREVNDWDITTNATPEEIQKLFEDSFYENEFGTVGVKIRSQESEARSQKPGVKEVVEVTPYRKEAAYSDKRHPDSVEFTASLEEDLARRDFTVNAIAMNKSGKVHDPFDGKKDIEKKTMRAVGDPSDRFAEDALRLMRAVRFAAQLGFTIEKKTAAAIKKHADGIKAIANERIRDELVKIVDANPFKNSEQAGPEAGFRLLHRLGLLTHIIPELEEGVGVEQSGHHEYTVFEHNIRSLGYAAKFEYNTEVRMAALLHDIGKPRSKRGKGEDATFYGHDIIGARMAKKILKRLHFSNDFIKKVVKLVRYHMFYYDVGEVTESSVRRLIRKVGTENIDELLETRIAERKGSGVPKAEPYRLRHLRYMIDKVSRDPLSTDMLEIDGNDIMQQLGVEPGPRIGTLLNALLEEVLDDPNKNTEEYLSGRLQELNKLSDEELKEKAQEGKSKLEKREEEIDKRLKDKHHVK